jgi:hypothetical protein
LDRAKNIPNAICPPTVIIRRMFLYSDNAFTR